MEYAVQYGVLPAGKLEIGIRELDTLNGRPAYHIVFRAESNAISTIYDISSVEESWFDAREFYSLREKESTENDKTRTKEYVFDQRRQVLDRADGDESPASPRAVDQVAICLLRAAASARAGMEFVLRNQADPNDNPPRSRCSSRSGSVPAGSFDISVLDLDVTTDGGPFKKGGENRIWVTTDARHVPVKISSRIGVGSFEAELVDYARGAPVTSAR